jgi:hypothetical protein
MDSSGLILIAERLGAIKLAAKTVAASAAIGVGLLAALLFISAHRGHDHAGMDSQSQLAKSELSPPKL